MARFGLKHSCKACGGPRYQTANGRSHPWCEKHWKERQAAYMRNYYHTHPRSPEPPSEPKPARVRVTEPPPKLPKLPKRKGDAQVVEVSYRQNLLHIYNARLVAKVDMPETERELKRMLKRFEEEGYLVTVDIGEG